MADLRHKSGERRSNMKSKALKIVVPVLLVAATIATVLYFSGAFFTIKGKWKNIGDTTFGQIQKDCILIVTDNYCNLYSPKDTYAFYSSLEGRKLEITSFLFGEKLIFDVSVLDNDNIILERNSTVLQLRRVD